MEFVFLSSFCMEYKLSNLHGDLFDNMLDPPFFDESIYLLFPPNSIGQINKYFDLMFHHYSIK